MQPNTLPIQFKHFQRDLLTHQDKPPPSFIGIPILSELASYSNIYALAGDTFTSADLIAAVVVFLRVPHTLLIPLTGMCLDDLEPLLSPTVSDFFVHSPTVARFDSD